MSLFSSLQMAGNTLSAMQIGLHVVGNNIANANTPGFIREKAIFAPAPVQKIGNLALGLGVEVDGIVQVIDKFVENRLRDAGSDLASAEAIEDAYTKLEAEFNALGDANVGSFLTTFFNSIDALTGNPQNTGLRDLAIKSGVNLAQTINTLNRNVQRLHTELSTRVQGIAPEINTLTEQIAKYNLQIVAVEAGGTSGSDAGGLRTQRAEALKKLAGLVDISATETITGSINVSVGGQILVFEGTRRAVESALVEVEGSNATKIQFVDNKSALDVSGGELHGIYQARDTVYSGFLTSFDELAASLAFEFNKIYSQGQGTEGFTQVTSTSRVNDAGAALNVAGLDSVPTSGKFNVIVRNKEDNPPTSTRHEINIDLNGLDGNDTTLSSLAAQLNAIDGITASVNLDNHLVLAAETSAIDFSFEVAATSDESGVLAALGLNTFFTGSDASSLGVNAELLASGGKGAAKFAASLQGIGSNSENALRLVALYDQSLTSLDGSSIRGLYDSIINTTTQGASIAQAVADGQRVFTGTLQAQSQSVSGVNLDEEALDMIALQRTYQASARFISTISELLDILVNI
jgi:flagellar hook-associated protein 1 FlgK